MISKTEHRLSTVLYDPCIRYNVSILLRWDTIKPTIEDKCNNKYITRFIQYELERTLNKGKLNDDMGFGVGKESRHL